MIVSEPPFQLLYVSRLVTGAGSGGVAASAAVSRPRNAACWTSGALLFDGDRFCQLIEGSENEIRTLMAGIEVDSRHCCVVVLTANHCVLLRLMTRWRSGYCAETALDVFETDSPPSGEVALALFMSTLNVADVD